MIPIVPPNGTSVTTLSDGTQTLTLSSAMTAQTVPGGGWSTWNTPPNVESATPRVLAVYTATTTQTITLSQPMTGFGVEIEPDTFAAFSMTLDFKNGATTLGSITRTVNGSAGALLFAASSPIPITSVVLTAPSGANGHAYAQFRYGNLVAPTAIPALSPIGLAAMALALMMIGVVILRRQ